MFRHGLWKMWLRHPILMFKLRRNLVEQKKLKRQLDETMRDYAYIRAELKKVLDDITLYLEGTE